MTTHVQEEGAPDRTTPEYAGANLTHNQIVTILTGLMLGMFLAALDQTIVATSIRTIADKLNGLSAQAWVTTAYLITSTIVTPLYGKLSDIYGRKKFFMAAISIFTIGSVLCTLSWSIPSLAFFRAIQGLGAGGLFSLALAVGLVPLLIVAEQGREWGWGSGQALLCYVIGAVGLTAGWFIERAMGDEALIPLRLFTIPTVKWASIGSIFIGMGMFGGIAAIPLYLQIVKGASATQAGLQLVPMTLGIMFGSILSGQLISRTGRYRRYPIMGAALLVVSLFAFHYVTADTPLWQSMIVMVFFGMGLGFNFQPLTLAIQNAVPLRDIGVATSSATFTRQIGGTLGTAIFLSLLFSSAKDKIGESFRVLAPQADFQAALRAPVGDAAANQAFISQMKAGSAAGDAASGFGNALNDSSFLNLIDPRLARPFLVGFSDAMSTVFLVASVLLVFAFIASLFLPHVELRSAASFQKARAGGPDDGDSAAPTGAATEQADDLAPPAIGH